MINPDRYIGLEGFAGWSPELADIWDAWHVEAPEMVEHGDRLFVTHEVHARGKGSGVELVRTYWSVWTLRDGKGAKLVLYLDRAAALAGAGLSDVE